MLGSATRSEPLVPAVDLPGLKKRVNADIKEIKRLHAKLATVRQTKPHDAQAIQAEVRNRTEATESALREAEGIVVEGTAAHATVSALAEVFRGTLSPFQPINAEAGMPSASEVNPFVNPFAAGVCHGADSSSAGRSGAASGPSSATTGGGEHQLTQIQVQLPSEQQQIEQNERMLQEREVGIDRLNHTVREVADVFQDLALLVNEQGTRIDNIEANIEITAAQTRQGVQQVERAARYQRSAACCGLCVRCKGVCAALLVVFVVLLVLIIALNASGSL